MRLKVLQKRKDDLVAEGDAILALEPDKRSDEQKTRLVAITSKGGAIDQVLAEIDAAAKLVEADRAFILREGARIAVGRDRAADAPWGNFGLYLQAVHRAHTGKDIDARLLAAASGMGVEQGADGGFAVPVEFAPGIEKNMWDTGQILSRVSERPLDGNSIVFRVVDEKSRVAGSRSGGVLGYWVDEGTAPDASRIKLARIEMRLRKVAALGYVTDELMEDAPALAAELQQAFTDELRFQVEDAVVEGTGAGQPLGIMNAPCKISVSKETNQAAATIVTTNLSKMWARLPAWSKANSVWLYNVDVEPQLDELTIPAGTAAVEPRFVTYGPDGILRIKGRPCIPVEYCSTVGTEGDLILADLSAYRLIRKSAGVQTASSIHVRFTQGENTFRATYRVDGQPVPRSAITPFKGSSTVSPFVTLATRS